MVTITLRLCSNGHIYADLFFWLFIIVKSQDMVPEEVSFSRDVYSDSFPEAFDGLSISSSTDKTLLVTVQNHEILYLLN